MIKIVTKNEDETKIAAERLGMRLFPGAVILLSGNLGAGKTIFVKGLANGLNVTDLVKSPSYTIINVYDGQIPLIHFDLYRLTDADEFYAIGADEYVGGHNVCAAEWHSNVDGAFGKDYMEVIIKDLGKDRREITFMPKGKTHKKWFESIKDDINS